MIAEQFDLFLVDLDGVVYVGSQPLPGARESLHHLRRIGKRLRFLTNDPRPTRQHVRDKLAGMGIKASLSEVITSGYATANYLRQIEASSAYVVGSEGLATELYEAGVTVTDSEYPDAVVVGCDNHVSYSHLQKASRHIINGSRFVATNADPTFPVPDGREPATGAIVAAVEVATDIRPTVIGKPNPWMFIAALRDSDTSERTVVIGDSVATDVLGAHKLGLSAILIADRPYQPRSASDFQTPDLTISSLGELFAPGWTCKRWQLPEFSWPERISPGVAAVVLHDDRIMLVKRADNGLWAIPSGRVEPGETVVEAITREVLEETGVEVEVRDLIGVYSDPIYETFTYPSGETLHLIFTMVRCDSVGGSPRPDGIETLEVGFFDVNDLPPDQVTMNPRWLSDALTKKRRAVIR